MVTVGMLERLCCPTCRSPLRTTLDERELSQLADGELACTCCGATYAVHRGVPDLVPRGLVAGHDWDVWQRHLDVLQARRGLRTEKPGTLIPRLAHKGGPVQRAFAQFSKLVDGSLLDVGCGPGKFRLTLPDSVNYHGIDPIPLPEVSDFPFARALAEHIPFLDSTFTNVTVLAALDHFKDPQQFLLEAIRVLRPDGRLHILQTIHERMNPLRSLTHMLKDAIEDRSTEAWTSGEAPHHMSKFDARSIRELINQRFDIVAEKKYSGHWYSPVKVFLTLAPRQ